MAKKVVAVLFGGRSGEHEVSLKSAQSVMKTILEAGKYDVLPIGITKDGNWVSGNRAMERLIELADPALLDGAASVDREATVFGYDEMAESFRLPLPAVLDRIDVAFPVLHGPGGEDGTVQGMLALARIPCVGCGVLASSVGMDKIVFKKVMQAHGIPVIPDVSFLRSEWESHSDNVIFRIEASLQYPLFCKPANMGSSVGISKCPDRNALVRGIQLAAQFDRRILVEWAAPNPREIEISVLGNDNPVASVPGEVVPKREFYDYTAKYIDSGNAASNLIVPAQMDETDAGTIGDTAIRAYKAIDGAGMARVDFLLNRTTGELYLNELNTIPGFTAISMYSKLWDASGVSYPVLIDKLIDMAFERFKDQEKNQVLFTP
jgi:D-alanine-D-alanine ligase